jgi:deoxyhypusine synthase
MDAKAPDVAVASVFVESETLTSPVCHGFEFTAEGPIDYDTMFKSYIHAGFQASNLGRAIDQLNDMLNFKFSPEELLQLEGPPPIYGIGSIPGIPYRGRQCKIFLGLTSNLVSSGMREIIKFICKHKMVDVVCVSAGGVEEDIIKCLATTHIGEFHLDGADLRRRGLSLFFWCLPH